MHICDIDEGALNQVADENQAITATICDVSDRSSVERFVSEAAGTLGGIDVLINNGSASRKR